MNDINRCIFSGMNVLTEDKWEAGQAVVVEGGKIKAVIPASMIKHHLPAHRYKYPENYYLIPGLIDTHVHGAEGHDVMDGSVDALIAISHVLAAEGVTGFLATTMTADNKQIDAVMSVIPSAMKDQQGAAILGVHLEGPFIAASKMGAQNGAAIQLPDLSLFQHWQALAEGAIKLVTLAPELPGAIPFIKSMRSMGVVTSVGHTNATYEETCAAITAGCSQATHLFNAMSQLHQRAPGAVGALLLSNEINAELILDGLHLAPAIAELALRVKGKDRLMLVTDAMRAKCLGDGHYDLGGQRVEVKAGKATLNDGTLAGSTLRMPQAIKNMTEFTGCSLMDAVQMASHNPARMLGLATHKGDIDVGKEADLVVLSDQFEVMITMRAGREIFSA